MPAAPAPHRRVLPLAIAGVPEGDLAAYFEGLANPTRLRIVQRLAEEGREVFCRLDRESIQASFSRFFQLVEGVPVPGSEGASGSASESAEIISQPLSHTRAEHSLPEVIG